MIKLIRWLAPSKSFALSLLIFIHALSMLLQFSKEVIVQTGASYQVIGMFLAVYGLWSTVKFFGLPAPWESLKVWWSARPWLKAVSEGHGHAWVKSQAEGYGYSSFCTPADSTLEQKIQLIEQEIEKINQNICKGAEKISKIEREVGQQRSEITKGMRDAISEANEYTRAAMTDGISIAFIGAELITIGILFGTIPSEVMSIFGTE